MKPVVQLERTGCGIASVAALAGVSYAQAKRVANRLGIFADDPKLWSETDYVRRLLKEHGIRSARIEVPFTSWKALARSCADGYQMAQRRGSRVLALGGVLARAERFGGARSSTRATNSNSGRLRPYEAQVVHRHRSLYT